MFYPLKFKPVYKDYLWGGRNLSKLGKILPEGIVAESWEVSCHPDGVSIICNGQFKGMSLSEFINNFQYKVMGTGISWKPGDKFPLLVKLIDANNKLSVQVHPDDEYAALYEDDKSGKSEMWYVIWAKPGSKLVYGLKPDTTKENFQKALEKGSIEEYLNYIEVFEGDVINIPAGIIHAIGEGILLAEVQQNSNNTYRVYDYNRVDKNGKKRPLHIQKALDVIDFSGSIEYNKSGGTSVQTNDNYKVTKLVENSYFSTELYHINGEVEEIADGSRFYIYLFIEGEATICYGFRGCLNGNMKNNGHFSEKMNIRAGESIFIPAFMGKYRISGNIKAIKAYVPNPGNNIL
ncbi:MAG TPA: class I mannose-6-phosphate isomerase [Clostridiaceae bacterium]|jgi:mannose-6-phosphate isomerase|nr:class I mannose-6-phosphate isomerase [Clostridiaceae bacterium]